MMNQGKPINLTDEQRVELERRVRSQTRDARSVRRAKVVLLAADGVGNHEIARRLEISCGQAIAWRSRFAEGGMVAIESDLPRSGRKPRIDAAEIVRVTTQTTPEGATHWGTRKLKAKLGVSDTTQSSRYGEPMASSRTWLKPSRSRVTRYSSRSSKIL
jgi:transposase